LPSQGAEGHSAGPAGARFLGPSGGRLPRNRNEAQFDKYRNWQWIKHLALADYVVPWAAKLGSIARTIFVVDLFAGAGTYVDGVTGEKADGSPVIFARQAMKYAKEHSGRSIKVICVERNTKNWEALRERVKGFPFVTVLRGGFARHIERIVSTIGTAPALILFDPIGLKPIAAERIRPLLHRRGKTDVFMILHFKVVHRTAGMLLPTGYANPTIPSARRAAAMLDAVFGTHRWRFIAMNPRIKSVEERERAYLELYREEVLGERYEWCCAFPVRANYFSKVQYWLVHASDHLDAHLLMNDEIAKLEELLYTKTYENDGALDGFHEAEWRARIETEEERLRERMFALVAASSGGAMTFEQVRRALLSEFFGRVKQGAYSRAAKALVHEERLLREQRPAAKFEPSERLSVPRPERRTSAASAA
jgi:three-Cys-motif partner protein